MQLLFVNALTYGLVCITACSSGVIHFIKKTIILVTKRKSLLRCVWSHLRFLYPCSNYTLICLFAVEHCHAGLQTDFDEEGPEARLPCSPSLFQPFSSCQLVGCTPPKWGQKLSIAPTPYGSTPSCFLLLFLYTGSSITQTRSRLKFFYILCLKKVNHQTMSKV